MYRQQKGGQISSIKTNALICNIFMIKYGAPTRPFLCGGSFNRHQPTEYVLFTYSFPEAFLQEQTDFVLRFVLRRA